MKLLFDQNLSRRLATRLAVDFPESEHVTALGLDTATDDAIWQYAREHGFVIASKDSDFRQLAFLHGPPPKVVWLRVGNISTTAILQVIREYIDVIEAFGGSDDEGLLVLPSLQQVL